MFGGQVAGPWRHVLGLLDEAEARFAYVRREHTRAAARLVLRSLKAAIPKGRSPEWDAYRESLRVVETEATPGSGETVVAIQADPKKVALGGRRVEDTVVYVMAKSRASRLTRLLERAGPWTKDTLPAVPGRDADVVYRVVSERETEAVRAQAQAQLRKIGPRLQRAGAVRRQADIEALRGLPDVALLALRLEFGVQGLPELRAWRKAIRTLESQAFGLLEEGGMAKVLTGFEQRGWALAAQRLPVIDRKELVMYADFSVKVRGS